MDYKTSRKGIGGAKRRFVPDKDKLNIIEQLSGQGMTQEQIAAYFGIRPTCWYESIKRYPEIRERCVNGKAKTIAAVTGKLMQAINKGNVAATIFYLKTQTGGAYKERSEIDVNNNNDNKIKSELKITTTDPVEASRIYQQIMLTTKSSTGSQ